MRNVLRYDEDWNFKYALHKWIKEQKYGPPSLDQVEDFLRPYLVLSEKMRKENKSKISAWWRLTIPAWWPVFVFLLLVVCPINWISTGRFALQDNHPVWKVIKPWYRRLFP